MQTNTRPKPKPLTSLTLTDSASTPDLVTPVQESLSVSSIQSSNKSQRSSLTRSNTLPSSPRGPVEHVFAELESEHLERFRQWLLCIGLVVFDVDHGPAIRLLIPEPVELTLPEREIIAFSAFPNTTNTQSGVQIHSFRVRRSSQDSRSEPHGDKTEDIGGTTSTTLETDDGFLYGYSAFMQHRDKTSKRGFSQRSLIFLSQHPLPAFFSAVLSITTPLFIKHGNESLETACHNIAKWPSPTTAATLELGYLGSVLRVELPKHIDQQQLTETASFGEAFDFDSHILASYPPIEITAVELFAPVLSSLWSLWECLVLSEPLLIFSSSPAFTSAAVWWLRDLFRPLPFAGDFRPYFTIHDPDHKRLITKNAPQPGIIIGTTNPFLVQESQHWPHIVSLEPPTSSSSFFSGNVKGPKPSAVITGTSGTAGSSPCFKTTHKRYISKDHVLLNQLEKTLQSGNRSDKLRISNQLRQHFAQRSTALLVPLNRYLTSLIPTPNPTPNASPLIPSVGPAPPSPSILSTRPRQPPKGKQTQISQLKGDSHSMNGLRMAPFNPKDMLASLQKYGSPLPFKSTSKQKEFYEKWLRTNTFGTWLMREENIVKQVLAEREG